MHQIFTEITSKLYPDLGILPKACTVAHVLGVIAAVLTAQARPGIEVCYDTTRPVSGRADPQNGSETGQSAATCASGRSPAGACGHIGGVAAT